MRKFQLWHKIRRHRLTAKMTGLTSMVVDCSCGDRWIEHLSMAGIITEYRERLGSRARRLLLVRGHHRHPIPGGLMHDPMIVAFDIRSPWPRRTADRFHGHRWHWRRWSPFITLAGRVYIFPSIVIVWHVEPNGEDALRGQCKGTHWRWHIHHWRLQFPPLQAFRRQLLTRCEWCGGPSRKRDCVNHALDWDTPKSPWWRGERGLYHDDCTSVATAHRTCLCDDPLLNHRDYGQCGLCGKHRAWRQVPTIPTRYLASLPTGSRIPPDKHDWLKAEWAKLRAEHKETN